jgi:hypothetical protein
VERAHGVPGPRSAPGFGSDSVVGAAVPDAVVGEPAVVVVGGGVVVVVGGGVVVRGAVVVLGGVVVGGAAVVVRPVAGVKPFGATSSTTRATTGQIQRRLRGGSSSG